MRIIRDTRASSAAEFALVLPLLLLFLFGIIDGARWLWEINRAEKAAQAGARFAIVTNPLPGGLVTADYVGTGGLTQGDVIPKSAFGKVTCTNTACCPSGVTCTTPYPALGTFDAMAFDRILARMRMLKPDLAATNVQVSYEGSGLGYAGDPNGMDISPIVTVRVTGLTFQPITTLMLAVFPMPSVSSSLTAEDSSGTASN
ncbi:MAG: TadE/TadG family type IV pilus assembly protein [Sphingomicrobium sp.]